MAAPHARRPSRASAGLAPITVEGIVDQAVSLTVEYGLERWSLRQLSRALGIGPRVIYHHVGDREAVVGEVVQRVLAAIPVPDGELAWRRWFETMLLGSRPVLRGHPGVARRLVLAGPVLPAALVQLDRGIQVLRRAGLSPSDALAAYRYLLNSAFLLIAVEDDRMEQYPHGRAELARVLVADRDAPAHAGLAAVAADVSARGLDPAQVAAVDEEFYRYTVHRSLDGIEAVLLSGASGFGVTDGA